MHASSEQLLDHLTACNGRVDDTLHVSWFYSSIPHSAPGKRRTRVWWKVDDDIASEAMTANVADLCDRGIAEGSRSKLVPEFVFQQRPECATTSIAPTMAADQDDRSCDWRAFEGALLRWISGEVCDGGRR